MTPEERADTLSEIIDRLEEVAGLLEGLDDPYLNAYCLAEVQGAEGGWLGEHLIDRIRARHQAEDNIAAGEEMAQ